MGYVDIHSHILYGMDDGAKTREESLQMLQLAAGAGTSDIVATPHANSRYRFDPAVIDAQIADLNAAVEGIRVHRGCDFHLRIDNIEDAVTRPDKYTINGHGYLMVEFPDIAIFGDNDAVLGHLLDAGLTPIITHPERNGPIQRRLDDVAQWVESGCYVQVTAGSVLGTFGKAARECSGELMARGLVHFIASDAHDCRHRPPTLRGAYEALTNDVG